MPNANEMLCPHCGASLSRWTTPENSTWTTEYQLVCFDDDCPYFMRGWEHMEQNYGVKASYRFRRDPVSGKSGPLPVWSRAALKNGMEA